MAFVLDGDFCFRGEERMDKFQRMDKVNLSDLDPRDKVLLNYLIQRADEQGLCWPYVETLCRVRGIKHTKNFKGAEVYLPEFVSVTKVGRKKFYVVDFAAVEALGEASVEVKQTPYKPHTPSTAGVHTPSTEGVHTPSPADDTPSGEGANNSSVENTLDSSSESTVGGPVADAPVPPLVDRTDQTDPTTLPNLSSDTIPLVLNEESSVVVSESSVGRTPATEGVSLTIEEILAKQRETREKFAVKNRRTAV